MAGRGAGVVAAGGLLVVVGFGVGALGAVAGLLTFDFCLSTSTRLSFDSKLLGLKAISFWAGTCDTRGQGPPAQ